MSSLLYPIHMLSYDHIPYPLSLSSIVDEREEWNDGREREEKSKEAYKRNEKRIVKRKASFIPYPSRLFT